MVDTRLARPRRQCLELVHLHARYCGKPTRFSGKMDDWVVVGPALLARAAYGLESVLALADREIDAALVVRSIYEAVTLFAWIAVNPVEHMLSWRRQDTWRRLEAARELNAFGLIAGLGERVTALEGEFQRVKDYPKLRPLVELATQADEHWKQKLPDLFAAGETGFRGQYAFLYRFASQSAHGLALPLAAFVQTIDEGVFMIGRPAPIGPPVTTFAPHAFANGLAVASVALGWPDPSEIGQVFADGPPDER